MYSFQIQRLQIQANYEADSSTPAPTEATGAISENSATASKRPASTDIEEQAETQVKRPALRPATSIQPTKKTTPTSQPGPVANPQQDTTQATLRILKEAYPEKQAAVRAKKNRDLTLV
nr:unnamed protein product [Callosobruchus analis]